MAIDSRGLTLRTLTAKHLCKTEWLYAAVLNMYMHVIPTVFAIYVLDIHPRVPKCVGPVPKCVGPVRKCVRFCSYAHGSMLVFSYINRNKSPHCCIVPVSPQCIAPASINGSEERYVDSTTAARVILLIINRGGHTQQVARHTCPQTTQPATTTNRIRLQQCDVFHHLKKNVHVSPDNGLGSRQVAF